MSSANPNNNDQNRRTNIIRRQPKQNQAQSTRTPTTNAEKSSIVDTSSYYEDSFPTLQTASKQTNTAASNAPPSSKRVCIKL